MMLKEEWRIKRSYINTLWMQPICQNMSEWSLWASQLLLTKCNHAMRGVEVDPPLVELKWSYIVELATVANGAVITLRTLRRWHDVCKDTAMWGWTSSVWQVFRCIVWGRLSFSWVHRFRRICHITCYLWVNYILLSQLTQRKLGYAVHPSGHRYRIHASWTKWPCQVLCIIYLREIVSGSNP